MRDGCGRRGRGSGEGWVEMGGGVGWVGMRERVRNSHDHTSERHWPILSCLGLAGLQLNQLCFPF